MSVHPHHSTKTVYVLNASSFIPIPSKKQAYEIHLELAAYYLDGTSNTT